MIVWVHAESICISLRWMGMEGEGMGMGEREWEWGGGGRLWHSDTLTQLWSFSASRPDI